MLWDIPVGRGRTVDIQNGALNAIAGGWQVGSIITIQSGYPLNIFQGGDPSNTGHTFDRPDATGVDPYEGWDSTTAKWWNPAAFSRAADGKHGNMGRNTLTTPGAFAWDFSLLKDFNFTERHKLQFRFEAFNLPNHPVWGNPDNGITSATFGLDHLDTDEHAQSAVCVEVRFLGNAADAGGGWAGPPALGPEAGWG